MSVEQASRVRVNITSTFDQRPFSSRCRGTPTRRRFGSSRTPYNPSGIVVERVYRDHELLRRECAHRRLTCQSYHLIERRAHSNEPRARDRAVGRLKPYKTGECRWLTNRTPVSEPSAAIHRCAAPGGGAAGGTAWHTRSIMRILRRTKRRMFGRRTPSRIRPYWCLCDKVLSHLSVSL